MRSSQRPRPVLCQNTSRLWRNCCMRTNLSTTVTSQFCSTRLLYLWRKLTGWRICRLFPTDWKCSEREAANMDELDSQCDLKSDCSIGWDGGSSLFTRAKDSNATMAATNIISLQAPSFPEWEQLHILISCSTLSNRHAVLWSAAHFVLSLFSNAHLVSSWQTLEAQCTQGQFVVHGNSEVHLAHCQAI